MSDVAQPPSPAAERVLLPRCPFCETQPIGLSLTYVVFPQEQIGAMLFCSNPECCKVLSIQVIGAQSASKTPGNIEELLKTLPPVPRN